MAWLGRSIHGRRGDWGEGDTPPVATRRAVLRRALAGTTALTPAACSAGGPAQHDSGSAAPAKAEAPLLEWILWSAQPEHLEQYKSVARIFQEQQSAIKLNLVTPASGVSYFDWLKTQLAGGQPVDVIGASPVWVPDVATNGIAKGLGDLISRDKVFKIDQYARGVVDAGSWKGMIYFLTLFGNFNVLYYNKGLLERAGIKYPDENWTLDMALDAAKRIAQRTGNADTDVFGMDFNRDLNQVSPYLWANGGEAFDKPEEPAKATMSSPATLEAFTWLVDLINKHKIAPGEGGAPRPSFTTGRVGMVTQGVNSLAATARVAPFSWDIAPLPRGKRGRPNFSGTLFYGLASASKSPDASWTFLKFLCGEPGQGPFVRAQIGAPVLKGLEKSYLELPPPPDNRKVVIDALPNLKALPKAVRMMEIYEPVFTKVMAEAFAGTMSATEAAHQIDSQVAAILGK